MKRKRVNRLPFICKVSIVVAFGTLLTAWPRQCSYPECHLFIDRKSIFDRETHYCLYHEEMIKEEIRERKKELLEGASAKKCIRNDCTQPAESGSVYCSQHKSSVRSSSSGSPYPGKSFSSRNNSYNEGYDEVYDSGDYDTERYRSDREYAAGVDDALEDEADGDY